MKYMNARDLLPESLVKELQGFIQGGYVYVPKEESNKVRWGEGSGYRMELDARNREIVEARASGESLCDLSERYGLSVHAIKKILYSR